MGDRTWLTITIRTTDRAAFDAVCGAGWDNVAEDGPATTFRDGAANYGGAGMREKLVEHGIRFFGEAGPGEEYGPEVFAFDGRDYVTNPADQEGNPVVHVEEPDFPDQKVEMADGEQARASDYFHALFEARLAITGTGKAAQ